MKEGGEEVIRSSYGNMTSYSTQISHLKISTLHAYTQVDSIIITHNDNFSDYSSSGDGNAGTPYIIKNYNITYNSQKKLINIQDTTKYFIVRDCLINGISREMPRYGIYLENVIHGTIDNNTIIKCNKGVILNSSSYDNIIANNTIENTGDTSVYLEPSVHHNVIFNNTISDGIDGIYVASSTHNNTLSNNTIIDANYGINMKEAINNTIVNNFIHTDIFDGIHMESSKQNVILNNNIP